MPADQERTVVIQKASAIAPGTQLNGVYEIERPLAPGGMGYVYLAREIGLKLPRAIKFIRSEIEDDPESLRLFYKEAENLSNLHHDAIVRYYGFNFDPALARHYLAMEFIEGQPLHKVVQQRGPLSAEEARTLLLRISDGLKAAHSRGIVHRDISPDNLIIPDGSRFELAKIIDFGIARASSSLLGTVVSPGSQAGKPSYMSPEQCGMFGGEVNADSDIYSLGLVMYFALTGRPLDMGGSLENMLERRRSLPDIDAAPAAFHKSLRGMLEPDPTRRALNMSALAEIGAKRPAARRSWRGWAAAAVAIALAASGAAAWSWLKPTNQHDDAEPDKRVERFLASYSGPCIYVAPTSLDSKAFAGKIYASTRSAAEAFAADFTSAIGSEPDLDFYQIASGQCPALEFLAGARGPRDIRFATVAIDAGNIVNGAVSGKAGALQLLLVDQTGETQDASSIISQRDDPHGFGMQLTPDPKLKGSPVLLIVVAAARPLSTLRLTAPRPAQTVFPAAREELAGRSDPVDAALWYGKLR